MPSEAIHRTTKIHFLVKDKSDITLLVSRVEKEQLLIGASLIDASLVKTILHELCSNIVKYAKRGSISIERVHSRDEITLEIIAADRGPGIPNIDLALQDKFSTGGSLGLGLPGVRRMSDNFEILSSKENGTIIKVKKQIQTKNQIVKFKSYKYQDPLKKYLVSPSLQTDDLDISTFVRPSPGEIFCGDKAFVVCLPKGALLCITDVSGHGDKASELANEIESYFSDNATQDLECLVTDVHLEFKGSRGAAMGLLYIDYDTWRISYCGVGNTGACLISKTIWRPISKEGIIGQRLPNLDVQTASLSRGDVFFMWTDGLPDLASRNLVLKSKSSSSIRIASDVVKTLGRPGDDAGCLILRRL